MTAEARHNKPIRVLALRALGLGDFLTGIPAYRCLRRAFPEAEICLAAPEPWAPLARMTGAIDHFVPAAELAAVPWHGDPPQLAVDLHGRGAPSHRLLSELRPERLIAFADPESGYPDGPRWQPGEHEVRRWCRLLAESGIPADPQDLDLLPNPPRRRIQHGGPIIIHPGAGAESRRWGASRFAQVAAALRGAGHSVLVTAGPGELILATRVVHGAGLSADAAIQPVDAEALVELVASARLVVCGDTGIAHLATALRVPSVVLFGPTSPAEWGPPPRPEHVALWHGKAEYQGDPHGASIDPVLDTITVDEVLIAARAELDT